MLARRVEVVKRAGDQQISVGVEIFAELVALVAQIAFHLEIGAEREGLGVAVLQVAPELLMQRLVGHIGDMAGFIELLGYAHGARW